MKKVLLLLGIFAFSKVMYSQESVEKSLYGIQLGIYPLSVYHEMRLADKIALRSEAGMTFGFSSSYDGSFTWQSQVEFNLEPRYYYNLNRRVKKGKKIFNNSGNYWALNIGYMPPFVIGNDESSDDVHRLHIIPCYGLRRTIGQHFNFETSFGLGYFHEAKKSTYYPIYGNGQPVHSRTSEDGTTVAFRLAIGYCF